MDPISVGALSLLPPILAVALALFTKEVFSSLIIGILSGTLIYTLKTDGNVVLGTVETAVNVLTNKFDINIILFCSLLGSVVYIIYLAGGARAYGRWASKAINSKRKALASTSGLGAMIFIDDYFNCLTVGTVMRPITDRYRISRAKLSYIIDSTAAPICILAPISSWAAAIASNLAETKAFDSEIMAFVSTIPWNFYAILSIFMVFLVCMFNVDFGPMRAAEKKAKEDINSDKNTSSSMIGEDEKVKENGSVFDMLIPVASLIIVTIFTMLYFGGYWGDDPAYNSSVGAAFGNTDSSKSLVLGSIATLFILFFMVVPRGLLTLKEFMEGLMHGIQAMIPANMVLTLAWTISGVTRDLLSAPQFISSFASNDLGLLGALLPAVIFLTAAFLAFSIGSSWGTFGILIPIIVTLAQAIDPSSQEFIIIALSATLAGSVCGDHCSPISDTTVLSSAGSHCDHINHVYTQLPYAILVALTSFVGYVVAGLTRNLGMSLGTCVLILIIFSIIVVFRNKREDRKEKAALS